MSICWICIWCLLFVGTALWMFATNVVVNLPDNLPHTALMYLDQRSLQRICRLVARTFPARTIWRPRTVWSLDIFFNDHYSKNRSPCRSELLPRTMSVLKDIQSMQSENATGPYLWSTSSVKYNIFPPSLCHPNSFDAFNPHITLLDYGNSISRTQSLLPAWTTQNRLPRYLIYNKTSSHNFSTGRAGNHPNLPPQHGRYAGSCTPTRLKRRYRLESRSLFSAVNSLGRSFLDGFMSSRERFITSDPMHYSNHSINHNQSIFSLILLILPWIPVLIADKICSLKRTEPHCPYSRPESQD